MVASLGQPGVKEPFTVSRLETSLYAAQFDHGFDHYGQILQVVKFDLLYARPGGMCEILKGKG